MENDLKHITNYILTNPDNYGGLYKAAHQLHQLFADAAGIAAGDITDSAIHLDTGKAVSPIQAAHCLLEFKRTAAFLTGIYKAIRHLQTVFLNKRINIFYAGCGPYATLITPLTTLFTAQQIGVVMMDINPVSIEAMQKLYRNLQIEDYIIDTVLADASHYQIDEGDDIHLVISETMQAALQNEPQVFIMRNLIPQMQPNAIFIPENITVSAKLVSAREEQEAITNAKKRPVKIDLGNVYSVGMNHMQGDERVIVNIPHETGDFNWLELFTDITIFKDDVLTLNNCSLNLPVKVCNVKNINGRQIAFTYRMTSKPGLEHQVIEPQEAVQANY